MLFRSREETALADFSRAIELDPAGAAAYVFRGLVCEAMERQEDAAADYSRAIELEPRYGEVLASLRAEIPRS